MISIAGLDKVEVLRALYAAAKPQGMGYLHYTPGPLSREDAEAYLAHSSYFDYLNGRVMKVEISGDELSPRLFDRDNGEGAAALAIENLRSGSHGLGGKYPVLVSKEEHDKTFICEKCLAAAPANPWPKGWTQGGRSRLRIPPDNGVYLAEHCPSCSHKQYYASAEVAIFELMSNPTEQEIDAIRKGLVNR